MFGSSGIRGITNADITPQLALNFGLTIGNIYPQVVFNIYKLFGADILLVEIRCSPYLPLEKLRLP